MEDDFCVKKPSKKYFSVSEDVEQEALRAFSQAASSKIPVQEKVREMHFEKPNPQAELEAKNKALYDLRYEIALSTTDANQVLKSTLAMPSSTQNITLKPHQSLIQRKNLFERLAER